MKSEKPTPPATEERAEFEQAYRAYCGWGNFDKQLDGRYLAGECLDNSWAMWQAARADRAELLTPITNLLTNIAQILDVVKQEWGEAWSSWDQEQRDAISTMLYTLYARNAISQSSPDATNRMSTEEKK